MVLPIIAGEAIGELIGSAIDQKLGDSRPMEQRLVEDFPESQGFLIAASTGGPGVALAMERILEAVKAGRASSEVVEQIAKNFGVEDRVGDLAKFAKAAESNERLAKVVAETAKTIPPEGFGARGTKAVQESEKFLEKQASKELGRAQGASKRAQNRFLRMAGELARESDVVKGVPYRITETAGLPSIPTDALDIPDVIKAAEPKLPPISKEAAKYTGEGLKNVGSELNKYLAEDITGTAKKAIKLPVGIYNEKPTVGSVVKGAAKGTGKSAAKAAKGIFSGLNKLPTWAKVTLGTGLLLGGGTMLLPEKDRSKELELEELKKLQEEQRKKQLREQAEREIGTLRKSEPTLQVDEARTRKDRTIESLEKIKRGLLELAGEK